MNVQNVLPRDAIPSIDDPAFDREYIGRPDDEVIVVEADPPRAYPIRILSYHEIVNDVVDDRPVAVTWCPICWSAVVFDRCVRDRVLSFGMSGKLADDALVMYDRKTESEWKQPTGEAFTGELAGTRLDILPFSLVSYERFVDEHPDGVVLQPVRGTEGSSGESPREIYEMDPYDQYVDSPEFGLYGMRGQGQRRTWDRDDLDAKTVVLGIEDGNEAVGYPIPRVEARGGIVVDTVGELDVVVVVTEDGIHAFEDPGFELEHRGGEMYGDGASWNPVTGEGDDGRRLERIPGRRLFAFAWQDAHGPRSFYG